jgi:cation:H+ antiporter
MLASALLLMVCVLDIGFNFNRLSMIDGAFFLIVFASYIYDMIRKAKHVEASEESEEESNKSMFKVILVGLIGLAAIVYGGDLVVNSASAIAAQLGMSENLIGLTVIALGTSLPELVTSVIATKKGETEIAIGNVIGSNIFNILLVLGTASLISPMAVSAFAVMDVLIMVGLMSIFIFLTHKKQEVNKVTGIVLLILYVSYLIYTIMR